MPCELVAELPDEGIVLAHSDMLPSSLKVLPSRFIIELKPDRYLKCVFANYVITQNKNDRIMRGLGRLLIDSATVPYWPQPGLIARDAKRGDRFENICFIGNTEQFLQNTSDLAREVNRLGLNWQMVGRDKWHDYSNIDAIVAVRQSPSNNRASPFFSLTMKPASKLYNAWLAGVPAILSPDVAYLELKKSNLDFLPARNVGEIVTALEKLKYDPALKEAMVQNGHVRGREFEACNISKIWVSLLKAEVMPKYIYWKKAGYMHKSFYIMRKMSARLLRA